MVPSASGLQLQLQLALLLISRAGQEPSLGPDFLVGFRPEDPDRRVDREQATKHDGQKKGPAGTGQECRKGGGAEGNFQRVCNKILK